MNANENKLKTQLEYFFNVYVREESVMLQA